MDSTLDLPAAYADVSRRHAAAGDVRMAQLAAWAGDVHVLEELLWRNGLADAPDPAAELSAVGHSVASSVEEAARSLPAGGTFTAREVVEAAREAMITTFDESVHGLLSDRFDDIGQLDVCRPADGGPAARGTARLSWRSASELAAELRSAAGDCATMAELLDEGGEPEAARRLAGQSETAAFEAYLVSAAVRSGDDALATVDLRSDLVAGADGVDTAVDRRERLVAVLGSAERDGLRRTFAPAP